jgi:bifunctional non-homologous end joining protein LigD
MATRTRRPRPHLSPDLLTHKSKILFPEAHVTKEELGDYYDHIAPFMLPFLRDRPLAMHRFPNGINGESFYQKEISEYFPKWVDRVTITNKDGSKTTYVVCQNRETLVYLAYQACITFHVWLSKRDKLDYPDHMVFDLDPGEKTTFDIVRHTALMIKEYLEDLGLISFPMTTGSRGIHVVVPIRRTQPFEFVHPYALSLAKAIASENPEQLTADIRKEERHGRLFIDAMRNTYAHLSVAPYSVRARSKAPVATPLLWEEVKDPKLQSQSYTIRNIFDRLKRVGNVWEEFFKVKNTLKKQTLK